MRWEQQIQYATISDIGFRRRNNQDACCVLICSDEPTWNRRGHLLMVADGMGGHAVGELASKIAADTLPHTFFKIKEADSATALKTAIETANATIYDRGMQNRDFKRMGTTCSALVLCSQGAIIGHVGDSRVYRIRDDRIDQLTFDHSLQWELLKQGKLRPEEIFLHEPRHVITRSLGPEEHVEVDVEGPYVILPGDIYLLCSDGLTGHLKDHEIGVIAREFPPGEACRLLANLANLRGGSDNITIVVARVGPIPEGAPSASEPPPVSQDGPGWWSLAGFWGLALVFALGVVLVLLGMLVTGAVLSGVAVIVLSDLIVRWIARRPMRRSDALTDTVLWKSYRSASASFSVEFLNHLVALEAELQRSALEEGWSIEWSQHETAYTRAKAALSERQYSKAMREIAKAIDVLMAGVQLHRRQMERKARWGKVAPPTD